MKYTVTAPTRIDLAGGTLDLHPLYLFLERPLTINASLNLRSMASVTPLPGTKVVLHSLDLGQTIEANHPDELKTGETLDLLVRAVKFYAPLGGFELTTKSSAPKGSGLGASSSLLMSISKALCDFTGEEYSRHDIIHFGAAIEAQNLGIPTGFQDYYGAWLGGINGLAFGIEETEIRAFKPSADFKKLLDDSLVVSFTGVSHFSGTNNWNMLKRFIDKEGDTVERMLAIQDTAHELWKALVREDMDALASSLNKEWDNRRGLAEGVSTPAIDKMMLNAKNAGAMASKLCGAGGGGCMMTIAAPGKREAVIEALRSSGAEILNAAIDEKGLTSEVINV